MSVATRLPQRSAILQGNEKAQWLLTGLIALLFLVLLYTPGMMFIARWWTEPEYSHGWIIPLVTGFILWQRRSVIISTIGPGLWSGLALVAVGLLLYLFGTAAQIQRFPFISLIIVLVGLSAAALGRRSFPYTLLPLLFLLFATPLPGSLYVPLSTTLQAISSKIGAAILEVIGISVLLDGNIIDLGVYKLQVAEACSGLRYLFPLACFGFLCAWIFRAPMWARALVFLSIAPITVLTNSARIALTGIFIEYGSIELAEGFMHLFEGWVIFLVALAALAAEMWLLARIAGASTRFIDLLDFDRLAGGAPSPAPASLPRVPVPASLVACVVLLIAIFTLKLPLENREQILPSRPPLITFPLYMEGWKGQPLTVDPAVLKQVGASDYLIADFVSETSQVPVNLWVAYYETQLGRSAIHSPKDCLPGGGWEYVSLSTVDAPVRTAEGKTFQVNRGLIAKGQEQMVVYYWLETRGRKLTTDVALKLYNLWDSFAIRRSDGALVRLMSPILPGESEASADRRVMDFLTKAYVPLETYIGE